MKLYMSDINLDDINVIVKNIVMSVFFAEGDIWLKYLYEAVDMRYGGKILLATDTDDKSLWEKYTISLDDFIDMNKEYRNKFIMDTLKNKIYYEKETIKRDIKYNKLEKEYQEDELN